MAGQPIRRGCREVLGTLEEQDVWVTYLQEKTVRKLLVALSEKTGHDLSSGHQAFYDWLDEEDGRRDRWARIKKMRGDAAFDEVEELADSINEDNVRPTEAKIRAKQWIAERLNKAEYGRESGSVNIQINAQHAWLGALREAEAMQAQQPKQIEEADYTIEEEDNG